MAQSYGRPSSLPYVAAGNLTDDVLTRLRVDPNAPAVATWTGFEWRDVSIAQLHERITGLAKGLIAHGIQPGDRVALLSRTRYEWTLLDYALWWVGAVTVPLYESTRQELLAWTLTDAGVRAAIVEHEPGDRFGDLPVWVIENDGGSRSLADLVTAGRTVTDADLEARRVATSPDDIATVIYTSGTTGTPKGCPLTHGNLDAQLDASMAVLGTLFDEPDASTLLFLPLAHVLARIVQIGAIRGGVKIGHTADIAHLEEHLATFAPTFILTVPRVLESLFNAASQKAYADNRGAIFDHAAQTAISYSRALDRRRPSVALKTRHAVLERTVYAKIRSAFGPRLRWAISGGAPLGERMAHFYRGIGIPVLEGYGLTETSGAIAVNTPENQRLGTVGQAIPGIELRIEHDGELSVRGPSVFSGYWHEANHAPLSDDGWLATGDVGEIDGDGFLRIFGRKQEILVTAGGKNVSPAILEDRIRAHPYVSQCLVVGDGKPFVGALVTIDRTAWTGKLTDPRLRVELQAAIDEANAVVSQAEAVRKFAILDAEWTEENGYLTPSHKVRRSAVLGDFHDAVEALFVR